MALKEGRQISWFPEGIFVGTNNVPLIFLSGQWVKRVS